MSRSVITSFMHVLMREYIYLLIVYLMPMIYSIMLSIKKVDVSHEMSGPIQYKS